MDESIMYIYTSAASHCWTINNETIRHNLNFYILHMTHFSFLMELFYFMVVLLSSPNPKHKVKSKERERNEILAIWDMQTSNNQRETNRSNGEMKLKYIYVVCFFYCNIIIGISVPHSSLSLSIYFMMVFSLKINNYVW